jgi:hypothetical protein
MTSCLVMRVSGAKNEHGFQLVQVHTKLSGLVTIGVSDHDVVRMADGELDPISARCRTGSRVNRRGQWAATNAFSASIAFISVVSESTRPCSAATFPSLLVQLVNARSATGE